jgi:hypothetical protein
MNPHVHRHAEVIAKIEARGRVPIPPAIADVDDPQPLAVSTRQDIVAWVKQHNGAWRDRELLAAAIAALVRTPAYIRSLAAASSVRVSILTGEMTEAVSDEDRASAIAAGQRRARQKARALSGKNSHLIADPQSIVKSLQLIADGKPKPPQVPKPTDATIAKDGPGKFAKSLLISDRGSLPPPPAARKTTRSPVEDRVVRSPVEDHTTRKPPTRSPVEDRSHDTTGSNADAVARHDRVKAPSPFRRGAPISAEEVERRRAALASLKRGQANG